MGKETNYSLPVIRALHPELPELWTIGEVVRQAGLHGLPLQHGEVGRSIRRGTGPALWGMAAPNSLLIEPQEGLRWIKAKLERRRTLKPTLNQRMVGVTEENFGTL